MENNNQISNSENSQNQESNENQISLILSKEYNFCSSEKNKKILIDCLGYTYHFHRSSNLYESWKCSFYRSKMCKTIIKTKLNNLFIQKISSIHCHASNPAEKNILNLKKRIKEKAKTSFESTGRILLEEINKCDSITVSSVSNNSLKRTIQRSRINTENININIQNVLEIILNDQNSSVKLINEISENIVKYDSNNQFGQ